MVEEPGRYHFNQVIKVNISADVWMYIYKIYDEKVLHFCNILLPNL